MKIINVLVSVMLFFTAACVTSGVKSVEDFNSTKAQSTRARAYRWAKDNELSSVWLDCIGYRCIVQSKIGITKLLCHAGMQTCAVSDEE